MTFSHMMRPLFLLLYLMGLCWGTSFGFRNESCPAGVTCAPMGPAEGFLQCVGLHPSETGPQHLHRLRSVSEALMDLYTFMRASVRGVPVLSLAGELDLSLPPLQNKALVEVWLEVKMKPLLHSLSRQMLSCLSAKNFSCDTYQLMVKEMSEHYSHMDKTLQKLIYDMFMFPFLAGDGVQGCVEPHQNSVDWIMKNFGDFKAMARVKDFSTLYMAFSGLEVLHLLSPAQKAEILLHPEVAGLDNDTLHLVFSSLTEHPGPSPTTSPATGPTPITGNGTGHNWTTPGYNHSTAPPHGPDALSIDRRVPTLKQVWDGFMTGFRPVSRLVHDFVTLTQERDVASIHSTDLVQLGLNFTLAELAALFKPSPPPERPQDFDPSSVEDWYTHVVMPVLVRFLPKEVLTQGHISMAFHELFYLENGMNETLEIQDVCSITVDQAQCGLTDVVEDLAHILHCAAQTHLTLDEETVLGLLLGLTPKLTSLLRELTHTDLHNLVGDIKQIFTESTSVAVTEEHLTDPAFIQLWFQVKLWPLLPDVSPELLTCLSRKNFSCPVYQALVRDLSDHIMEASLEHQQRIYKYFIYAFLQNHNSYGARCAFNNSTVWIIRNFGFFSRFASIADFYSLNPDFNGVDALLALTPQQIAQLLLKKPELVPEVLDFILSNPNRPFEEVMGALFTLLESGSTGANVTCATYTSLFVGLNEYISASSVLESQIQAAIEDLIKFAPQECVPENVTCPDTKVNETSVCRHTSGPHTWSFSNISMDDLCYFPLERYACAQLENFTANHLASLLSCDLPGNSHSRVLWKLLLTKLSPIVDSALDILAAMNMHNVSASASVILDVLGELQVFKLTGEDLRNSSLVHTLFYKRLGTFLPHVSGSFLRCLSSHNLSCSSYQLILQSFSQSFGYMTLQQQQIIVNNYIVRFLSSNISGPGCLTMNSSLWLQLNLGPFSELLPLGQILQLNPHLDLLEVLPLLNPEQSAALLALPPPPEKEVLINQLFDKYTEGSAEQRRQFTEFLSYLPLYIPQGNLSCPAFRTLFNRLDMSVSLEHLYSVINTKVDLSYYIPFGCDIYGGECTVTNSTETVICAGVNSSSVQLLINQGHMSGRFCDFPVNQLACASLSTLTAANLTEILTCPRPLNSSGSRASWKLLLSKVPSALNQTLDLLANTTLNSTQAALILDAIREIRLDSFTQDQINQPQVIQLFRKLRPFLSVVSMDFLHCLTTKALNCSTYQHIVRLLSLQKPHMSRSTQMFVYTHFIKIYLSRGSTADPGCLAVSNSTAWMILNLGAFSSMAPFSDLLILHPGMNFMKVLPLLTTRQLAELIISPGLLQTEDQVVTVLSYVHDNDLFAFFAFISLAINGNQSEFHDDMLSGLLEVVFDRLSPDGLSDFDLEHWLTYISPLLTNISLEHVAPFFKIFDGRSCLLQEQGLDDLNEAFSTLSQIVQIGISDHVTQDLRSSLRCYGNDSFYKFLQRSYMNFPFPSLAILMSLMPLDIRAKLLNSMNIPELNELLWRPDVTISNSVPCDLLLLFEDTPGLLETGLPDHIRESSLECVWAEVLSFSSEAEIELWFGSLSGYFTYLNKNMLSSSETHNSSCVAFRSLVNTMRNFNFTGRDFNSEYMFDTISAYLRPGSIPHCYNATDPLMNSTAWFAEYFGVFFEFMTLDQFQTLGSAEFLQVFAVDLQNIALLNASALPQDLLFYYTSLVYLEDINFSPILLPLVGRCVAPALSFIQLNSNESLAVLDNLTYTCPNLTQQTAAALAWNFKDDVDVTAILALQQFSVWLSTGQLRSTPASVLEQSLGTLGGLTGWRRGQSRAIVEIMLSEVDTRFSSASSLLMLGSLAEGLTTSAVRGISRAELQTAVQDQDFLHNLLSAEPVTIEEYVRQLISVYNNGDDIVSNIQDDMMAEVPRVQLTTVSSSPSVLQEVNRKKWRPEQVELFFSRVAQVSATDALNGTDALSSSVLQGFSCTTVRSFPKEQILSLIKACRRTGNNRVPLVETQLTCMYFYIQNTTDVANFSLFPADLLLYYDYAVVPDSNCRSYFYEMRDANYSVISTAMSFKIPVLFENAKSCLGITNTSLTRDQVSMLGNMCCTLGGPYIQTSDSSILERLKNCPELTTDQANAVKTLLESGNTTYGAPSTWNLQTLKDLGTLALYLNQSFYERFNMETKESFVSFACGELSGRGSQYRQMREQIRASLSSRSRRSTGCTVGVINPVVISGNTFNFNYFQLGQFNACLDAATVKENLDAISAKLDIPDDLRVVLTKLNEAYTVPSQNIVIPENQVQILGLASRVATSQDISYWTITQVDTLASLMDRSKGMWNLNLVRQVIMKYLSINGNSLGPEELNAIGGLYLCTLDNQTLSKITPASIRDAKPLDPLSSCTLEQKRVLFNIAVQAFPSATRADVSVSTYQLIRKYLGGANAAYVKSLVNSNINMDLPTFISLDPSVMQTLSVSDVQNLLGAHTQELKSYQNNSVVQAWIGSRTQEELNTLGLGLRGGRETATTAATTSVAGATNNPGTTAAANGATNAASTAAPGGSNTNSGATTGAAATNAGASTAAPGATTAAPGATTAAPGATTAAPGAPTSNPSVTSTTATANTTGRGVSLSAPSGLFLLLLLLVSTYQHIYT